MFWLIIKWIKLRACQVSIIFWDYSNFWSEWRFLRLFPIWLWHIFSCAKVSVLARKARILISAFWFSVKMSVRDVITWEMDAGGVKDEERWEKQALFPPQCSWMREREHHLPAVCVFWQENAWRPGPRWYYSKNTSRDSITGEERTGNETAIEKKNQAAVDLGECER